MKKILAAALAFLMVFSLISALAEESTPIPEEEVNYDISNEKYWKLKIGITTPFTGNFFSDALGNNISDQDIRRLIHNYSLVIWDNDTGSYHFDTRVVSGSTFLGTTNTYTFAINEDLKYCDGTPITAEDYAFSLLLQMSPQLREAAGMGLDGSKIRGYASYASGNSKELAGVHLLGDYTISLTIDQAFLPYFYELKMLDVTPMPISIIAPGCSVKDDGYGAYIDGNFTADVLKKTLLNPATGYMTYPTRTCGPYYLREYDGTMLNLRRNPYYAGNTDGSKVGIPVLEIYYVDADEAINELNEGKIDLLVRNSRVTQVQGGMTLRASGDFAMTAYSRNGLAFINFCAEKGPTSDVRVRKALSMLVDKEAIISEYLGSFGTTVKGYYGLGQWMYRLCVGSLVPSDPEQAEAWEELTLDGLTEYVLDPEWAAQLLDEAGWNLNANGDPYRPEAGGLRYANIDGTLTPLKLRMIYPENNMAGPLMQLYFADELAQVGGELTIDQVPMTEILDKYYGLVERDCDMIMLGSNFGDVFDPANDYPPDSDTNRLNGITDKVLATLCRDLRKTLPGDITEYCKRWLEMQEYRTSIATEIPLYINAYMDFYVLRLRNYEPGITASWSNVIPMAYLSDFDMETLHKIDQEKEEQVIDTNELLH